ncbi:class I SAM-dependent methyltransferase [Olivibacter ginsenosidimutans]
MAFYHSHSAIRRLLLLSLSIFGCIFIQLGFPAVSFGQEQQTEKKLDVPYVASKPEVVQAMLNIAHVNKNDLIYDLGCGDGRIVITAAKEYGATGVGVDIDPKRIEEANENAVKEGVTDKVKFLEQDLFDVDFSNASVVTLYLLPYINLKLRPKLLKLLKPGTRIVSNEFDMGDWKPEKQLKVGESTIYFWTVPKK